MENVETICDDAITDGLNKFACWFVKMGVANDEWGVIYQQRNSEFIN